MHVFFLTNFSSPCKYLPSVNFRVSGEQRTEKMLPKVQNWKRQMINCSYFSTIIQMLWNMCTKINYRNQIYCFFYNRFNEQKKWHLKIGCSSPFSRIVLPCEYCNRNIRPFSISVVRDIFIQFTIKTAKNSCKLFATDEKQQQQKTATARTKRLQLDLNSLL